MHYFILGAPIQDHVKKFIRGIQPREITREEIIESVRSQSRVRLFATFEEARDFAHALREVGKDYILSKDDVVAKSKVRPIITIEIDDNVELGSTITLPYHYSDRYSGAPNIYSQRIHHLQLHFYEVNTSKLADSYLVRAEFYNSPLKTIELLDQPHSRCVLV